MDTAQKILKLVKEKNQVWKGITSRKKGKKDICGWSYMTESGDGALEVKWCTKAFPTIF